MVLLILISVAILIWGFIAGWPQLGQEANAPVNGLLTWTYVMIGIAVFCWVVIGLVMSALNDPKSLAKTGIIIVGAAALCLVAFLLAKGYPAMGMLEQPSKGTLKLTDTILNLTYIVGGAAIAAIIVGEIRMAIANKKN